MREKTQADFDLEKMFEYIDEALTSKDERVQSALRGLLTIIELTRPQDDGRMAVETRLGPLRQMQEDLDNIIRRLNNLEGEVRQRGTFVPPANPYPTGPYNPGYPVTGTPAPLNPNRPPGAWWGIDPNGPWTTSKSTSASSYTLTGDDKDSTMNIKLTK
jgi:hypothetical protein